MRNALANIAPETRSTSETPFEHAIFALGGNEIFVRKAINPVGHRH
jgi:hypothetical protein